MGVGAQPVALSPRIIDLVQQTASAVEDEIRQAGGELAVAAIAQEVIELNGLYRDRWDLVRTAAIRSALQAGFTYADVATVTRLSRQRIQQLAEMPPATPGRRPASQDRSAEAAAFWRRDDEED